MTMYSISHQVQLNAVKQYCFDFLSFIANKTDEFFNLLLQITDHPLVRIFV